MQGEHTLKKSCLDTPPLSITTVRVPTLLPPPPSLPRHAARCVRADASVVVAVLAPSRTAAAALALCRGAPWNSDAWKAAVPDRQPNDRSPTVGVRERGRAGRVQGLACLRYLAIEKGWAQSIYIGTLAAHTPH